MRASFVPPHPTPGEYRSGAPGEGRSRPTVAEFIQMVLCPGGERSFAVEAGREVRILVRPEEIDDHTATRLARDIVKKIEEQLTYPGQIKVTVIRETRAAEYPK